jgi:hypothetical protein
MRLQKAGAFVREEDVRASKQDMNLVDPWTTMVGASDLRV